MDNPKLRDLVKAVRTDVSAGNSFASAIRKHPEHFDELFCNLVDSGEQSGALETMLDRVATYKEKTESLKAKIKKAMTYPISVICVAFIVSGILLIKVVPQFEDIFAGFGAELPAFTQMVIGLSEFAQAYWFAIVAAVGLLIFSIGQILKRSELAQDAFDRMLLKMPIVGDIINKSAVARFARTLSTTFAAGVPLVDALKSVSGATGNVVYKQAVDTIADEVSTGTQLTFAMRATGVWPNMVLQMTSIGEESGALDEMLDKATELLRGAGRQCRGFAHRPHGTAHHVGSGGARRRPDHRHVPADLPARFGRRRRRRPLTDAQVLSHEADAMRRSVSACAPHSSRWRRRDRRSPPPDLCRRQHRSMRRFCSGPGSCSSASAWAVS